MSSEPGFPVVLAQVVFYFLGLLLSGFQGGPRQRISPCLLRADCLPLPYFIKTIKYVSHFSDYILVFFYSVAPKYIKMFVLDEADEMLSRGFKDQIYDIFQKLNSNTQVRKTLVVLLWPVDSSGDYGMVGIKKVQCHMAGEPHRNLVSPSLALTFKRFYASPCYGVTRKRGMGQCEVTTESDLFFIRWFCCQPQCLPMCLR